MSTKFNPIGAWFETAAAMNAAALTIGLRTARLQQDIVSGRMDNPENFRMLSEKAVAAGEGAAAAGRAWTALWWKAALAGAPLTMGALAAAAPSVAMAASRPGFRAARANARRLSRRR